MVHDPQNTYIVTTKYYVLLFLLSVSVVYLPAARCPEKFPRGSPFGLKLLQRWKVDWGTGIRGLMRGMATLPQANQELLVVRDKVGTPPGELGVSKSTECDIFPFSALTLLLGRQEGHPAGKNWMLVCWW